MTPDAALQAVAHVALALAMPPLLLGVIGKTKALFAGRVGPPVLQLYYDLAKLARKGSVFSTTTTWVFRAGPVVGLATALLAALVVPLGSHGAPIAFTGDLVLFAYLFGLGRFFTVSAALDTGSAFEGMGGAREATFACLAEPALFLGLLVLVRRSASMSLSTMLGPALPSEWASAGAPLVLVVVSLVIVLLAESSRIPVDDPNTHLELTMIHEAMLLEYSARHLALMEWAAALKLFNYACIGFALFLPWGAGNEASGPLGLLLAVPLLAIKLVVAGAVLALIETLSAKLRVFRAPEFLATAFLLAVLGLLVHLLLGA